MFKACGCAVCHDNTSYLLRGNFSICGRDAEHLVTRCFHCAGFVDIDVGTGGAKCRLMRTKRRRNDSQICLCATHQKMDCDFFISTKCTYSLGCLQAVQILTITGCLLHICGCDPFQHFGVTAFTVIVMEIDHENPSAVFFPF